MSNLTIGVRVTSEDLELLGKLCKARGEDKRDFGRRLSKRAIWLILLP